MKTMIVLSDSHGNAKGIEKLNSLFAENNYIVHLGDGEGDMTLGIDFDEESRTITFRMTDKGVPFDPLKKPDPDITLSAEEREIGGLGIFIAKKTMDSLTYAYENGENILTMIKKI